MAFSYDPWGNLWQTNPVSGTGSNPMSVNQAVNGQNQFTLLGYGYDAAGNVLSDGVNASACAGNHAYNWNAEEEMICAAGTDYVYNGDGERVEKSSGTLYWDGGLAESDLSGNLTSEYISFNNKRIARRDVSSGSVYYYFSDVLGSSNVITNATGTVENESDFYPFGGEYQVSNSIANHYKFTGKERDSESGNDYFGARHYTSSMGRFLSPDWSAKAEPVPYAKLDDPQTLNLYGYLRNNPLGGVDADGHCGGGPNDPPCSDVKVQAKVTQQPKIESNTAVKNSDGKVIAHGTGPTGGQIKDTVTVNGKPAEGVGVAEKNVLKNTENGVAQPSTLNENRSAVPTDSNGEIVDNVTMQQIAGSAEVNNSIMFDMSTNVYTSTDEQTLTLTFPSGGTCTATSTRVMTNAGPDGQPSSTYTLRTTQPVLRDPSN